MTRVKFYGATSEGAIHEKQAARILCPACGYEHVMGVGPHYQGPVWQFNGDTELPVFSPSLLMRTHRWEPPVTPENLEQWRKEPWPQERKEYVCHSFIGCNGAHPGQIVFLSDCTHHLAGQVVELPHFPQPPHVAKQIRKASLAGAVEPS